MHTEKIRSSVLCTWRKKVVQYMHTEKTIQHTEKINLLHSQKKRYNNYFTNKTIYTKKTVFFVACLTANDDGEPPEVGVKQTTGKNCSWWNKKH